MNFINNIKTFKPTYTYALFLTGLIFALAAGLIVRIKLYCCNFSFWNDEAALALNLVDNQTYFDMFKPLENSQSAPPFFMIISKFLLDISGQINNIATRDLILRIFPLIASIIALPLFSYTVHKIFKNNYFTLITTSLMAFNKTSANYAQEFKPYAVDLLFSLILFLLFYNYDIKNYSTKKVLLISLFFAIVPWLSYSSLFVLAAGFLYIIYNIIKNKCTDKLKLSALFIPVLISGAIFGIHYKIISSELLNSMIRFWSNRNLAFFTFGNFYSLFNDKINDLIPFLGGFGLLILIPAVIIFILKNNKKAIFLTLTPILLCIIASFMQRWPFDGRLILFLLPSFIILIAQYYHILTMVKKEKIISTLIFIAILTTGTIILSKENKKRRVHYSSAREFIQTIQNENGNMNNVITYTLEGRYYMQPYNRKNTIINEVFFNEKQLKEALNSLPQNEDLWLYIAYGVDASLKSADYIKNSKQYEILSQQEDECSKGLLIKFRKK